MATLSQHQSQNATKLLLIGDSGTGKTGALASLVQAGYELVILDFDNGLDILVNVLRFQPNAGELLSRVRFETVTDRMKAVGGLMIPDGVPQAFSKAMNLLTNWKTTDEDLGPVSSWNENRVLVIDSLTFMSDAAYRFTEVTSGSKDGRMVFFEAQKKIENCLGLLYSPLIKCNVIVIAHIAFIETDNNLTKGYPATVGKALSPKVPRYFNAMLQVKRKGTGDTAKRVIASVPDGLIDLKTPLPAGKIPNELPIETGLAEYFKVLKANNAKVAA